MKKLDNTILPRPADLAPTDVTVSPDGMMPAPAVPTPSMKLVERLTKTTAMLIGSMFDRSKDADFVEASAAIIDGICLRLGCDPMRPAVELPTNAQFVARAWQELFLHQGTLTSESPNAFRRIDVQRVTDNLGQVALLERILQIIDGGRSQVEALRRYFLGELAPTAAKVFFDNRPVIESHSKLAGQMPNLIALAVGAGQEAAQSRVKNQKVREQTKDQIAAQGAGAGPAPAPAPAPAPSTPPIVVAPPAPAAAAAPAPHLGRRLKG